ncbi:MAG TPA: Ig-like domain-containing protein [Pirellulales bacterium]
MLDPRRQKRCASAVGRRERTTILGIETLEGRVVMASGAETLIEPPAVVAPAFVAAASPAPSLNALGVAAASASVSESESVSASASVAANAIVTGQEKAQSVLDYLLADQIVAPGQAGHGALPGSHAPAFIIEGRYAREADSYFAAIALRGMLDASAPGDATVLRAAERWFTWYFSNLNADGTIDRIAYFDDGREAQRRGADADDSAASLPLVAMRAYLAAGGSVSFFRTPEFAGKIQRVADLLVSLQQPNGLTRTFTSLSQWNVGYVMDGAESYAGYKAAEYLAVNVLRSSTRAAQYRAAAARTLAGLYGDGRDAGTNTFNVGVGYNVPSGTFAAAIAADPSQWYPGLMVQFWPLLNGAGTASSTARALELADQFWSDSGNDWTERLDSGWLALAHKLAGDEAQAKAALATLTQDPYQTYWSPNGIVTTIADAGFILRMSATAFDDSATATGGLPLTVDVRANDFYLATNPTSIAIVSGPQHGAAIVQSNGTILYQAAAGYVGTDQLTYRLTDSRGNTGEAVLTIAVASSAPVAGAAASLEINPASAVTGRTTSLLIRAIDSEGRLVNYTGDVRLGFSTSNVSAPTTVRLVEGVATVPVAFKKPGAQTLKFASAGIAAGATLAQTIAVSNPATQYLVSAVKNATAGDVLTIEVQATDKSKRLDRTFNGTVNVTTTDPRLAGLGPIAISEGRGTFTLALTTAGTRRITIVDPLHPKMSGNATVRIAAGAATHYVLTTPPTARVGRTVSVVVQARDAFDNVSPVAATVRFSSSDPTAKLPAETKLSKGAAKASIVFRQTGVQTIGIVGTLGPIFTATSLPIIVS